MDENNNHKHTRGVTLREPKDVRRVIQRITSKAFQENKELELAGRRAQLMGCWMKAWKLEEIAELKKRVERLEEERCAEASAVQAHIKRGLSLAPGMEIAYVIKDAKRWEVDSRREPHRSLMLGTIESCRRRLGKP